MEGIEDWLDNIDASIFTGDKLYNDEVRESIKAHAERWLREIARHEQAEDEVHMVHEQCSPIHKNDFEE